MVSPSYFFSDGYLSAEVDPEQGEQVVVFVAMTIRPDETRIIYIRFYSKSAFLLPRIKNQNTEAEIQKLIVESSGHL